MRNFLVLLAVTSLAATTAHGVHRKAKTSATLSPAGEFNPTPHSNATTTVPVTTHNATTTTTHHTTTHNATITTTHYTTTHNATTTATHHTTTHNATTTTHHTTTHNATTTTHHTTAAYTTSPSIQPTPSTNLTVGDYTLQNSSGGLCVKARMAVQIRLEPSSKANGKGIFIIQPNMTKAEGSCGKDKANFTLVFREGALSFQINKNDSMDTVYVSSVSFFLTYPFSATGSFRHSASNTSVNLFPSANGHCFSCSNISVFMGHGFHLDMSQTRLQAFTFTQNDFGPQDRCSADQTNYSVAIIVGVVLLLLILIVVAVYCIGRRKRADGYQSL